MKYLCCFIFLLLNNILNAHTSFLLIGNTKVEIIHHRGRGKTFVHLHENETTALKAIKAYVKKHGGSFITLKHSGERNIVFTLKNKRYEFDPNRIFTDRGIKKTLQQFGSYSPRAQTEVKKLANKIKAILPPTKIIAVHNNKDYSLRDYFPEKPLAADAKAIHYLSKNSIRNFYFVTKKEEFLRLKALKFNVALQARKATDDGSLSFYLGKKNYINIEAAYNAFPQQVKMLAHA